MVTKTGRLLQQKLSTKLCVYFLCLIIGLCAIYHVGVQYDLKQTRQNSTENLEKLHQYFTSELARFTSIPNLVRQNTHMLNLLDEDTTHDLKPLNEYLADIQIASGASDVYVLNEQGWVTASSNWQASHSYIGSNFAFRQYFYEAVENGNAIDFAVGLRSGARGIYISQAIEQQGEVKGVIVVKVNASHFEDVRDSLDTGQQHSFILMDSSGIVLMSDQEKWRLISTKPLSQTDIDEFDASRQFSGREINTQLWRFDEQAERLQISTEGRLAKNFVFAKKSLNSLDASLYLLSAIDDVTANQWSRLALSSVLLLALFIILEVILVKLAGYKQLLFTQRSLEAQINARSEQLLETQQALLRTAKLATIGQLSAGINHEISQPLTAMSAYLTSSKRLLLKGQYEKVQENLILIEDLIKRTHTIVAQLKHFSKSQKPNLALHKLKDLFSNALIIIGPELKKYNIELNNELDEIEVWVDPILCEQVFVNLLSNACHAMQKVQTRKLTITNRIDEGKSSIKISDTGIGIESHTLESIFEPFFTTKSGNGLGLGLSISKQIIHSFKGELSAENNSDLGASFILTLRTSIGSDPLSNEKRI
ncbi:sensor histidine kinase [Pseudoalteromonas phenolica O-BC30]|nr:sensor histidine kinase [Pseudoalteromonas phenolica O-BC30]